MTRQLDCETAQLLLHFRQIGIAVIDDDLIGALLIPRLQTEVSGV